MGAIFNKKGVTIAELAVAATIGLLALGVLFYVSFTLQDNIRATSEILGINENGRKVMSIVSRDIRKAESVLTSYLSYTAGASTLILRVPSIDGSGKLITDANGDITKYDIIIYTMDTTETDKLIRRTYPAVGSSRYNGIETVAKKIDTFNVTTASSESVGVEILTQAALTSKIQGRLKTSCILRNKEREL
ncbi:MAG: hypothetical protein JW800_07015 [Candidatus Omnitrophica bacterium]|nr:hypothetical protein [Candidatus Omnitrophota bacterium]